MGALHRRSQAHEQLREYEEALADALSLKKLGGGGIDLRELEKRCESLVETHMKRTGAVNKVATDNAELFKIKERFDVVLEKYDLVDGFAAPEVASWLVSDQDLRKTVQRVAKRWEMSSEEAEHFCQWISKGLELKIIPDPRTVPKA